MTYGVPAGQLPAAPHCYRHPDRPTWIRCSRCDRPICPECMVVAAVGYQCPECVSAGAASIRQRRTVLGGRFSGSAAVSHTLIVTCVAASVIIGSLGVAGGLNRWGMYPLAIAMDAEWGRLVTSMFLHAGLMHLALNMFLLFLLGPGLEGVLGHRRFLVLYLLAGLGGSVASYCFSPVQTLSVGASGAIFGLMAAFVVIGRHLDRDVSQVVGLLALNVVLGFVFTGIDWRAHLGGAAIGAAVGLAMTHRSTKVQAVACSGVFIVLVGMVLWRTSQIQELVLF